jgi:hypothetical protein
MRCPSIRGLCYQVQLKADEQSLSVLNYFLKIRAEMTIVRVSLLVYKKVKIASFLYKVSKTLFRVTSKNKISGGFPVKIQNGVRFGVFKRSFSAYAKQNLVILTFSSK